MDVQLVMFNENGDRKDFPLTTDSTIIGRKEDCDIRIPLAEVSRQHAEFTLADAKLSIKDLKSANGTFVNNERVKQTDLTPGDRVVIGPVVFTVQIDGSPGDIKPAKTKLRRKPAAPPADDELLAEPDLSEVSGSVGGLAAEPDLSKSESFGDSLAESDLALEALSESSSMTFDLDDLDLDSDDDK